MTRIKHAKGSYTAENGELFSTIGWNPETNRYEARLYTWDGVRFDCVKMFAHSTRLILAARPMLKMLAA